jgi:hypothetical protein
MRPASQNVIAGGGAADEGAAEQPKPGRAQLAPVSINDLRARVSKADAVIAMLEAQRESELELLRSVSARSARVASAAAPPAGAMGAGAGAEAAGAGAGAAGAAAATAAEGSGCGSGLAVPVDSRQRAIDMVVARYSKLIGEATASRATLVAEIDRMCSVPVVTLEDHLGSLEDAIVTRDARIERLSKEVEALRVEQFRELDFVRRRCAEVEREATKKLALAQREMSQLVEERATSGGSRLVNGGATAGAGAGNARRGRGSKKFDDGGGDAADDAGAAGVACTLGLPTLSSLFGL